MNAASK
jgi:chemotaxis protein histidine kinase CheA